MQPNPEQHWQVQDRFLELHSRWLTLIGEHLQDHQGQTMEYWRVEKADSVIILPIQGDRLLLPAASYRPGVGKATLDFPGGRSPKGQNPEQIAIKILQRELGVEPEVITQLSPLNTVGWAVNSSFSDQNLYGFVAHLNPEMPPCPERAVDTYPATAAGVQQLLQVFTCLQCRAVLLEWWLGISSNGLLH